MAGKITLSGVVAGFPLALKPPKPLPGETLFHLVIRNHPGEWRNCVDKLRSSAVISPAQAEALIRGDFKAIQSKEARSKIEKFMNWRLPAYGRTIQSLKELKDDMKKPLHAIAGFFDLIEILWPRQEDPDGNRQVDELAEAMEAKITWHLPGPKQAMDLADLLEHVHGDFMWLVPGGTRFSSVLVASRLQRVVSSLQVDSRHAMYIDPSHSLIYRVSALRELAARGISLAADTREMAGSLEAAGYRFLMDKDPQTSLCELETEYGGSRPRAYPEAPTTRPWWKKVLGG